MLISTLSAVALLRTLPSKAGIQLIGILVSAVTCGGNALAINPSQHACAADGTAAAYTDPRDNYTIQLPEGRPSAVTLHPAGMLMFQRVMGVLCLSGRPEASLIYRMELE